MTRYEYEALKWNGEKVKGRIDAKSEIEVKVRVKNMGYRCISVTEANSGDGYGRAAGIQNLSLKEKIDFTQTFLTLIKAG